MQEANLTRAADGQKTRTTHDKQLIKAGKQICLAATLGVVSIVAGWAWLGKKRPRVTSGIAGIAGVSAVITAARAAQACDVANALEETEMYAQDSLKEGRNQTSWATRYEHDQRQFASLPRQP